MKFSAATILFFATSANAKLCGGRRAQEDRSITEEENNCGDNNRALNEGSILDLEQVTLDRQHQIARVEGRGGIMCDNGLDFSIQIGEFHLGSLNRFDGEPTSFETIAYRNPGWEIQAFEFSNCYEAQRQFSASVTAGFKCKQSCTVKIGFKAIVGSGEASSAQELEVSLSTTATQTDATTEEICYKFPLPIPPHTTIRASALVSNTCTEPEFEADVIVSNANPGPFFSTDNAVSLADGPSETFDFNEFFAPQRGFKPADDVNTVVCSTSGKFMSASGRSAYVSLECSCLREDWAQPNGECHPPDATLINAASANKATLASAASKPVKKELLVLNDDRTTIIETVALPLN